MEKKTFQYIASLLQAVKTCQERNNTEWEGRHMESISAFMKNAPSGSGFDSGTKLDEAKSNQNKLVFTTSFHHMNEGGFYDGWTEHEVIVTPSLTSGFNLRITGRNRNEIKEYVEDVFSSWLDEVVKV